MFSGIAHTRWATHGNPTSQIAHPHLSQNTDWAVVHNGIIENFDELKKFLITKNFKFKSQTDTEVISHLLQFYQGKDFLKSLIKTCVKLKGSYALAVINKNCKDTLFLAKNKSPLYVATYNNQVYVASDPVCFAGKAKEYFALEDNEFCKAQTSSLFFCNSNGQKILKQPIKLQNIEDSCNKKNYKHVMLKELEQTPSVLNKIVKTYKENLIFEKLDKNLLKNTQKFVLIGCGTAYHAGLMGASFIENFCGVEARCFVASEFRYSNPIINNKTLVILVSQSGETADTLMAQEIAKSKGAKTLALTNVMHSSLAKKADYVLPVCAGQEVAVASTKAYTAQIAILNMFAKYVSNLKNNSQYNFLDDIENLSNNLKVPSKRKLNILAKSLAKQNCSFFIGRNLDYITAEEASLKLKEITYIKSHAHPAGELKHGFLALVTSGTYVFVIATQKDILDKTLNAAHEAFARGAKLIIASQFKISKQKLKDVYAFLPLQNFSQDLMPISCISTFQMLSYLTSISKNINPDQPRNLAKSVTVE